MGCCSRSGCGYLLHHRSRESGAPQIGRVQSGVGSA
jgi:hypothetical protein